SNTSWSSTGYSNTHINQLINDYKLPHIISVACVNGNFNSTTCFAEAWTRATNNTTGNPTGAVAIYASSINQSWAPPMAAQDEIADIMVGLSTSTLESRMLLGGLYYSGSCLMMDEYGADGASMYKTWHIFGDCSIMIRSDVPEEMTVSHLPSMFIGLDTFTVNTEISDAEACLSYEGNILGSAITDESGIAEIILSDMPSIPTTLTLTVTAFNKVTYITDVDLIPNAGAYVVYSSHSISDGNNDIPEYGEQFYLNFSLNNVGSDNATDVSAIISTENAYVEIITDSIFIDLIEGETMVDISEAFEIVLADNVPDQQNIQFDVTVNSGNNEWISSFNIVANAPVFSTDEYTLLEIEGNNNGRIEPGETFQITFPVTNTGHSASPEFTATFASSNQYIEYTDNQLDFESLAPEGNLVAGYNFTVSEEIPIPSTIVFGFGIEAGSYSVTNTYTEIIAFLVEGFETGDLSSYDWNEAGPQPWVFDTQVYYEGQYALKSGDIGANQTVSIDVFVDVPIEGNLTFFKKVSSENNWDFFTFYIDNEEMGSWSGDVDWSQESYPITAEPHVFKWEYSKDTSVDGGQDCAWIDEIVFPATASVEEPIFTVSTQSIDFGIVPVGEIAETQFSITNFGNATLNGTIGEIDGFTIEAIVENVDRNKAKKAKRETIDYTIPAGGTRSYRVLFIPVDEIIYSGILTITTNDVNIETFEMEISGEGDIVSSDDPNLIPAVTELVGNYPNPFNPVTKIEFNLAESNHVTLEVYNILGQKVNTLANKRYEAGKHEILWEGTDANGNNVSSGVYFYKFNDGKYTSTKKMILLK
ncbi:MAG: C25 family peptidase C-terminal domain-containing protein, partial [Candidatus Cloacimonetes bacterium]|nr:C25 family peptidase C-terminal domain-containing protein [Candidatus Cloacimonadota bacterium]